MKRIMLIVLLSASLLAPAFAEDFYRRAPSANSGPYIGVKAGLVNYRYVDVTNNNQGGYGILFGYAKGDLAVEAEWVNLGGFETIYRIWTATGVTVRAVGNLPLNQHVQIYGKLGLAKTTLSATMQPGVTPGTTPMTADSWGVSAGLGFRHDERKYAWFAGVDTYPVGDNNTTISIAVFPNAGALFKFY